MKKKLLVMASTFPRWQNDTEPPFVYELSKRLIKDFAVSVLAPHHLRAKKYEKMDGMDVFRFKYCPERYEKLAGSGGILPAVKKNKWLYLQIPFFLVSEFFAARKQIKKNRPDVIHAHWVIPQGFIAALLKRRHNIPFLVTCHGGDVFAFKGKIATMIKRFAFRKATKITVVSEALKKELLTKIDPNLNVEVVPMGIDSKLFHPSKKNPNIKRKYGIKGPILLFVGRLAEKKGAKYLIEAMPNVIKEHPNIKLMIIGNGPLESELKSLTRKLGLEKNVIFTGGVHNQLLPEYYATADIFICPSIQTKEGDREASLPLTVMEALSSGLIVIATNLEGNADLAKNCKAIFLVKQRNSRELSDKIIKTLHNTKLKDLLKKESINFSRKRYEWKIVHKKYNKILNTMTKNL